MLCDERLSRMQQACQHVRRTIRTYLERLPAKRDGGEERMKWFRQLGLVSGTLVLLLLTQASAQDSSSLERLVLAQAQAPAQPAAQAAPQSTSAPQDDSAKLRSDLKMAQDKLKDWPNLGRYRDANAQIQPPAAGENRVVFMGDSITDGWGHNDNRFFPGKPYINRGISGQTTPQMLIRFRPDVIAL